MIKNYLGVALGVLILGGTSASAQSNGIYPQASSPCYSLNECLEGPRQLLEECLLNNGDEWREVCLELYRQSYKTCSRLHDSTKKQCLDEGTKVISDLLDLFFE